MRASAMVASGMHPRVIALTVAVSLDLGGCSRCLSTGPPDAGPALSPSPPEVGEAAFVHPSGLTLRPQPPEVEVRNTETGFRVQPANARHLRSPWSVQLKLVDADPLQGSDVKSTMVGERRAHYRLTVDEDVGSGGEVHTLAASAACGSRYAVMIASQQAEPPARPNWSVAWRLLEASRCGGGD